jgi:hypothetical protein
MYGQSRVYYMPGTTGWGATFGGLPAVLWNVQISRVRRSTNQIDFVVYGPENVYVVIQACTNLANPVWVRVQSVPLTYGFGDFSEPIQANTAGRYYRISSQ